MIAGRYHNKASSIAAFIESIDYHSQHHEEHTHAEIASRLGHFITEFRHKPYKHIQCTWWHFPFDSSTSSQQGVINDEFHWKHRSSSSANENHALPPMIASCSEHIITGSRHIPKKHIKSVRWNVHTTFTRFQNKASTTRKLIKNYENQLRHYDEKIFPEMVWYVQHPITGSRD